MKLSQEDKELLKQASSVKELAEHPGWTDYLKPLLEAKLNQSFPDPSQFKTIEEFNYAALAASSFKKVVAELLMYIESNNEQYKKLQSKKFKQKDPFAVGK